jgi:hypothetical protein
MIKPRTPQKETPLEKQGRDFFQTPNYATDLLVPFIPEQVDYIWEPACGYLKITNVLKKHGYFVLSSDIEWMDEEGEVIDHVVPFNFLMDWRTDVLSPKHTIITNPPYSLKIKFYKQCLKYGLPFALLISGDYSQWNIKAVQDGCEKIIPTKRIDYITPSGLSGKDGHTSYFHSYWLTKGFNIGQTETFVELTDKMKENI